MFRRMNLAYLFALTVVLSTMASVLWSASVLATNLRPLESLAYTTEEVDRFKLVHVHVPDIADETSDFYKFTMRCYNEKNGSKREYFQHTNFPDLAKALANTSENEIKKCFGYIPDSFLSGWYLVMETIGTNVQVSGFFNVLCKFTGGFLEIGVVFVPPEERCSKEGLPLSATRKLIATVLEPHFGKEHPFYKEDGSYLKNIIHGLMATIYLDNYGSLILFHRLGFCVSHYCVEKDEDSKESKVLLTLTYPKYIPEIHGSEFQDMMPQDIKSDLLAQLNQALMDLENSKERDRAKQELGSMKKTILR